MSGLNKFSLINSHQAGAFTNQNRIIDFTIPEGGVYDLSQSFVQLVTRCITANGDVFNMTLKNSSDVHITPKNIDLIRNCWLRGEKVGKLEDITRVNVLQSNLLELTKSTTEKMCMVNSIYQVRDFQNGVLLSPWVEWHKEGTVASSYRDNYLRVPLSQLYSLGSNIIDTSKTGALQVHIEIENTSYVAFEEVKLFHSPALLNEGKMATVTTVTSNITTVLTYDSVEASPYFVGQKLELNWEVDGTPDTENVVIEAITYNVVAKTITLQLDYEFPASTDPYEDIVATEIDAPAGFATLSIANANLGVCELVGGQKMAGDMLEYTTFSVEQYSNNANSLDRIFEVEANAVNAMLMFNNNTASLLSTQDKVSEYRMRIDNSDVYDRNIRVNYHDGVGEVMCHDPLHYDAINRTFLNAGLTLKNLTCLNMVRDTVLHTVSLEDRFDYRPNALMMLCTPLPLTAGTKKLQFTVETKDAPVRTINNVILFKQIVKMVKLA
jgi:hypothetical protein